MPEVVFEPRSTTIKRTSCLTYPLDHGFLFHICSPNDVTLIQGITILHPLCLSKYKNICYQFRTLRNLRIDIKDRLEDYNLRRLTSSTRSSSTSSFRSTLSDLKRGQQYLGALVAVVRSIRYMYITAKVW